jgi:hypothetical protein
MSGDKVETNERADATAEDENGLARQRCEQSVDIVAVRVERQRVRGVVDRAA